jgi:hypothetical protein
VAKAGTGTGTVTSTPAGIDCGADCTEDYTYGTEVTLNVTPDVGSVFTGWSGDADCSDGVVTMDAAKTCIAAFDIEIHSLTVTKAGTGLGTVTSNSAGIDCGADCTEDYTYGTAVTLDVTPDVGSVFTGWSGDADCSDGVITMDAAKACTAIFTITPFLIEVRVAGSSDDAEEAASGNTSLGSSDLELTLDGGSHQTVGMRFTGIDIPQGATISNAYIQFQVDETSTGATSLTVQGEAIGDAPTFASVSGNISSRARTASAVGWTPAPWSTVGESGPDQQTPDISSVIQEVIYRPDWTSGNSIVIIITGTGKRTAESYNGVASAAPLLHVEYSMAPPGNQAPDCAADADQTTIYLPTDTVSLTGTVTDDGLPSDSTVTTTWSNVGGSGAGTVTFGDIHTLNTTATFTADPGTYILRMTADDTELSGFCEITVEVREAPFLEVIVVSPDPATAVIGGTRQFSAEGFDQYGSPFAITPVWTAGGGDISPTGLYTAGTTVGQFTVTATDGAVNGTATVTVADAVTTIVVPVAVSTDDAEEGDTGVVKLGSRDLEITLKEKYGYHQTVGMRFNGLNIPNDATITNAYIQFQAREVGSLTTSLLIWGQLIGNAPTFDSNNGNISSRNKTAASVAWTPGSWDNVGDAGINQRTEDISSVIQEIVNHQDWVMNNSLVIIITGTEGVRVAESYNGLPSGAPLLHVEYSTAP